MSIVDLLLSKKLLTAAQLREAAETTVVPAAAGDYVRKNIFRYDYSLPKIR